MKKILPVKDDVLLNKTLTYNLIMNVLQTIDLKKYYGSEPDITRALGGVSLSVEQGEFVAI